MTPLVLFKLLADETRLLCCLLVVAEQELCVCELMQALGLSQPKVSRHLALLRDAELLLDRRQGQWVFYRINPTLPSWVVATLHAAHNAQQPQIQGLQHQLCQMGERPKRQQACC